MKYLYHTFFYEPLYNGLVILLNALPGWADMGVAIIIFTLIVKIALIPLSKAQIRTQIRMKQIEPKIKALKEQYKNEPQRLGVETMNLYRTEKINPLSGIFLILIQLPIIIALYHLFLSGGLPVINEALLYSFVKSPITAINMHFLGIDLAAKSYILAFLAGLSQFIQMKVMLPGLKSANAEGQGVSKADKSNAPDFGADFSKMMNTQMLYVMPIIILFAGYTAGAAIALYWVTSNIFGIFQEIYVRRAMVRNNEKEQTLSKVRS